jgi:hypothetical protein
VTGVARIAYRGRQQSDRRVVVRMQPAMAGEPVPVGPRRGRVRKLLLIGLIALAATFTALVVGIIVFVAPAAGAAGGCGGG